VGLRLSPGVLVDVPWLVVAAGEMGRRKR